MKSVGIDIGSYSIKVVELESKKTGNYKVSERLEVPLTEIKEEHNEELTVLEKNIKRIAHHYQGQSVRYVIPVNQEHVSVQYCSFPIKERHKIIKSLPFQLADDVPFNSNNAVYEAKFLASVGGSTELLALIATKNHVSGVIDLSRECGIEPDIVTSPTIALSNIFSDWSGAIPTLNKPLILDSNYQTVDEPAPAKVIIDIGHTTTNVVIYIDSSVVQSNTIFFGGRNIIEEISKSYELSQKEAANHLMEKGFVLTSDQNASKDQIFFSDTIKRSIKTELINPLSKIFLSSSNQKQIKLDNIYLLGGVSRLTNITDFFTKELNIETYLLDDSQSDNYKFTTAISLAIEGFRTPKNPPVNFIKGDLSPKSQFFYNLWKAYGTMIKVGAACVMLLFIHGIVRKNFSDTLSQTGYDRLQSLAKSPQINIKRPSSAKIDKFIKNKTKEIDSLEDLSELVKSKSAMHILEEISATIPSKKNIKLDVKKINIKNDRVTIEGIVDNQNQKQNLFLALQNISKDKKITQTQPQFTKSDPAKVGFAYSFQVDTNL